MADFPEMVPWDLERRGFDETARLAGAWDALFCGGLLVDWKHCSERKLVANPTMERYMLDAGILLAPVIYSDADLRRAENDVAADLERRHEERRQLLRSRAAELKRDAKEMSNLDEWLRPLAEARQRERGEAPPALPELPPVPSWWLGQPYKPRRYGTHPLTEHLPDESLVKYTLQLNWYQGMIEGQLADYGEPCGMPRVVSSSLTQGFANVSSSTSPPNDQTATRYTRWRGSTIGPTLRACPGSPNRRCTWPLTRIATCGPRPCLPTCLGQPWRAALPRPRMTARGSATPLTRDGTISRTPCGPSPPSSSATRKTH